MTLLHVKNQIVSRLCNRDTFGSNDFSGINVTKDLVDQKDGLIRAALEELEDSGLIKAAGQDFWILSMPLQAAGADVRISMPVCNEIAKTINTFFQAKKIEADAVDAMNIQEGHIVALLDILNDVISTDVEQENN